MGARLEAMDIRVTTVSAPAGTAIRKSKVLQPCVHALEDLIEDFNDDDRWVCHPSLQYGNRWYYKHSIVNFLCNSLDKVKNIVSSYRVLHHDESSHVADYCAKDEFDAIAGKRRAAPKLRKRLAGTLFDATWWEN